MKYCEMRIFAAFTVLGAVACLQDPEGYVRNKVDGKAYRLMYHAQTWQRAVEECEKDGAKLAVPTSQAEFEFMQRIVRGMYYPAVSGTDFKLVVYLGINNLDDYRVWKNIDGQNIEDTGFHTWASDDVRFSDDPKEPHCVVMDAANPGLRYWWCDKRQPYLCQKQMNTGEDEN